MPEVIEQYFQSWLVIMKIERVTPKIKRVDTPKKPCLKSQESDTFKKRKTESDIHLILTATDSVLDRGPNLVSMPRK